MGLLECQDMTQSSTPFVSRKICLKTALFEKKKMSDDTISICIKRPCYIFVISCVNFPPFKTLMCCKRKGVKQRERHFHEYAAIQQQFLRNSHTAYVPHIKVLHIIMMEMKLEGDFVQVGLEFRL